MDISETSLKSFKVKINIKVGKIYRNISLLSTNITKNIYVKSNFYE